LGPYTLSYEFTNYSDSVNPDAQAVVAFTGNVGTAVADDEFNTVFRFPFISTSWQTGRQLQAAEIFRACACDQVRYRFTYTLEPGGDVVTSLALPPAASQLLRMDFGDGEIPAVRWSPCL
jgi:hypothetical protein